MKKQLPHITFVAGLPGSGKSTWFDSNPFGESPFFDDFMASAIKDHGAFQCCCRLFEIVEILRNGGSIIMSEIRFCDPNFRTEVFNGLKQLVGDFEYHWICFENSPEICKQNARFRLKEKPHRDIKKEESQIDRLSQCYEPFPDRAEVKPVNRYGDA